MVKHSVIITPLNCGFGEGLNQILRMEESEYDAAQERSIYCKSPDISWFKMKSVTQMPYIEPVFYGLLPGDIFSVEYDAMLISGNTSIYNRMFTIASNYSYSTLSDNNLPENSLSSYYNHYIMHFVVPEAYAGIGIFFNIRPITGPSVIIIKNIKITIDTQNPYFSIVNNITEFRTRTDYMKCIDYISGTNVRTTYNGLLNVYNSGEITFPDDNTMAFSGSDISNFKGLVTMFNGYKYRPSVVVYCEYQNTGSTEGLIATIQSVSETGIQTESGKVVFIPSSSLIKQIMYINGGITPCRKTFIDVGRISMNNFNLKNIRFSMPQFDDSIKRLPNQIDELYTNLRNKLR